MFYWDHMANLLVRMEFNEAEISISEENSQLSSAESSEVSSQST